MPVIVVGADTDAGRAVLEELYDPDREIRAFVSDEAEGLSLKARGVKVAIGDVSDESHVEAASTRCFTAVLVVEAARDGRLRSFASTSDQVVQSWARAVAGSGVRRVIWVTDREPPGTDVGEVALVRPDEAEFAKKVADLDEAQSIS